MHSMSFSRCMSILILFLVTLSFIGCAGAAKKNFVDDCYSESKGLPMSQMDMLYTGYTKHDDTTAYGTLRENCPKAVKKYLK